VTAPTIRRARPEERSAVAAYLDDWGMRLVARLDELHDAASDDAIVAVDDRGSIVGLATYRASGDTAELTTLRVSERTAGTGSALVEAVVAAIAALGARRLWLITTNDNLDALRFYQRRGFRLVEIRSGAVDRSRATIKPSITEIGELDIPIRDEIVLERSI